MLEAIFTADSAQIITTTELGMIECKKKQNREVVSFSMSPEILSNNI